MNSGMMTMIQEEMLEPLLERVRKIDQINPEVGIRAFVWDILQSV